MNDRRWNIFKSKDSALDSNFEFFIEIDGFIRGYNNVYCAEAISKLIYGKEYWLENVYTRERLRSGYINKSNDRI